MAGPAITATPRRTLSGSALGGGSRIAPGMGLGSRDSRKELTTSRRLELAMTAAASAQPVTLPSGLSYVDEVVGTAE